MADIGIATLAMTQGIGSATWFLPKITDVRRMSSRDPEAVADIRVGESAMLVTTFGIGAMCSYLSKSPLPAIVALVTAGMVIVLYESVLQQDGRDAEVIPIGRNQ